MIVFTLSKSFDAKDTLWPHILFFLFVVRIFKTFTRNGAQVCIQNIVQIVYPLSTNLRKIEDLL